MKKVKLDLSKLKVSSFVTSFEEGKSETIKGGTFIGSCGPAGCATGNQPVVSCAEVCMAGATEEGAPGCDY